MPEETLDAEVKARVTSAESDAVKKLAAARRLSAAYIVREALTEYFRKPRKLKLNGNGKVPA